MGQEEGGSVPAKKKGKGKGITIGGNAPFSGLGLSLYACHPQPVNGYIKPRNSENVLLSISAALSALNREKGRFPVQLTADPP
jgi:hypothetical protein